MSDQPEKRSVTYWLLVALVAILFAGFTVAVAVLGIKIDPAL